ncbi:MAG: aldolase/citrate lyase family protein [Candidatus Latescibacteria bacterium]|nr:aldolase/citrate lyase family protein [Candidatus Latescibacterota bacterium]
MMTNKLLANMRAGRRTSLCQLYFPSATLVELMGMAGLDCVIFDGEHGTFTPENLDDLCRVAELAGVTPVARVPNIESSTIQSYLDRGVLGVFAPGIDTKGDAQKVVDACRFHPIGKRGIGGAPRWVAFQDYASPEQIEEANAQIVVVAFLEHIAAMDNIDEIMDVDGIDAYYVGRADASLSLGFPGEIDHPKVKEFEARVREAAHARGKAYFDEVIVGQRATNFFLDGARAFLEANKEALS